MRDRYRVSRKPSTSCRVLVSHSEGSSLAQQWGCPFIEASAKQRTNVNEMFAEIVREMNFTPDSEKKSYCCCILL
ncbi:hypothetical protein RUM44_004966 [Polyplax serrata]|uniref:Uncharacterized protein n=1 Tax=Polyplax serrata TaxID=468196 RepID=A0ABR1AWJ8_POLSC